MKNILHILSVILVIAFSLIESSVAQTTDTTNIKFNETDKNSILPFWSD